MLYSVARKGFPKSTGFDLGSGHAVPHLTLSLYLIAQAPSAAYFVAIAVSAICASVVAAKAFSSSASAAL